MSWPTPSSPSPGVPPADEVHAYLIAADALVRAGQHDEARPRLDRTRRNVDPRTTPGAWGEFLRVRGVVAAATGRATEGYHDLSQSATVCDLLGERYQSALSQLALGRVAARAGARSLAVRTLDQAGATFRDLGAARDARDVESARALLDQPGTGEFVGAPADADDAVVRRIVDAAALPELLARETCAALLEIAAADAVVVAVRDGRDEPRVVAHAGCDLPFARALARAALARAGSWATSALVIEPLGRDGHAPRVAAIALSRPPGYLVERRLRMVGAVARQGFESVRGARAPRAGGRRRSDRTAARAAHSRIPLRRRRDGPGRRSDQAAADHDADGAHHGGKRHGQGTGGAGHPRRLAARGGRRSCPTTARPRRGSSPTASCSGIGAAASPARSPTSQAWSARPPAARCFSTRSATCRIDVQPKLLRFLEQGEIMPLGETRPQQVDVRVIAATNADLEQRVGEGKFREDLFYRLSVIRLHVPPLRQRREEIPHLSSFFLREACEELAKPDVELSSAVLDLFAQHMWPGNVRQLRNEIRRAVAMSVPGARRHARPALAGTGPPGHRVAVAGRQRRAHAATATLAAAVDQLERDLIRTALDRSDGNISETARQLGLTRRGLYLKLRRLGFDAPRRVDTK